MHELIDESRGPGTPVDGGTLLRTMQEIWQALGHDDGRVPPLDEVLQEIRALKVTQDDRDAERPGGMHDATYATDDVIPRPTPEGFQQVSYNAFGMTITGYSAEDVLRIRAARLAEVQR